MARFPLTSPPRPLPIAFLRALRALLLLGLAACQSLPSLQDRPPSTALPPALQTPLGQAIAPHDAAHPGQSGVFALPEPREAFGTRVLLARQARQSIDVQYYIWRKDVTGTLLLAELLKAADRGVRVRLLLDDQNTGGMDQEIALVDAHPNVQVRLFNPYQLRSARWLNYLTDFDRLNRRMHNKSFTVDNLATIVGGRNIGDEYFGAGDAVMFTDLDVLGVGSVVQAVSREFDQYWASASSYPVRGFLALPEPERAEAMRKAMHAKEHSPEAAQYMQAVQDSLMARSMDQGHLGSYMEWTAVRMLSDDPAKALGQAPRGSRLLDRLRQAIGDPQRKLDLISPYFVPLESGTQTFMRLARQGVRIRILTNSLESTDVAAVHAGYAKRRKQLLEAGITLYELKRSAMPGETGPPRKAAGSGGLGRGGSGPGRSGSSGSSLHAKTFAVDDARVYVGSFNFDPRSAELNTEMGFLIDSPALASRVSRYFDDRVPQNAYQPRLLPSGELEWLEIDDDTVIHHAEEPGGSFWRRLEILLLTPLPLDWLL